MMTGHGYWPKVRRWKNPNPTREREMGLFLTQRSHPYVKVLIFFFFWEGSKSPNSPSLLGIGILPPGWDSSAWPSDYTGRLPVPTHVAAKTGARGEVLWADGRLAYTPFAMKS